MFVIAEASRTVVRLEGRFDVPQARSIEEMLSMFRPVRHVVIDFGKVREIDPAAVASLAGTLRAFRESRVTFSGLSRHLRRVLRYMGIAADGASDRARELAGTRVDGVLQADAAYEIAEPGPGE